MFREKSVLQEPNLAAVLILYMSAYLEEAQQKSQIPVPSVEDTRDAYRELVSLGLSNTQNALALKRELDIVDGNIEDKRVATDLINFVKSARLTFGPKVILVSNDQFNSLLERYHLTVGLLSNYKGVIPISNIADLKNVKDALPCFKYRWGINASTSNLHLLYIDRMELHPEDSLTIRRYVDEKNRMIPVDRLAPHHDGGWWAVDIPDLKDRLRYGSLNLLYGELVDYNTMFIACPSKYLNNPKVEVSVRPVDPVIFQYTPYGPLIYTAWGEEAEDVVLKKYMELNSKIASM